jgi:hypothetical protein
MREWCRSVRDPTLITIDTLKRVRPARRRNQTDYDADYEACQPLVELCHEFPGLAVVVLHRDRNAAADDDFDTVSGTLGLTGGIDAIALIKRAPKGLMLHIEGRDLEETVEKVIEFDKETARWRIAATRHPSSRRTPRGASLRFDCVRRTNVGKRPAACHGDTQPKHARCDAVENGQSRRNHPHWTRDVRDLTVTRSDTIDF